MKFGLKAITFATIIFQLLLNGTLAMFNPLASKYYLVETDKIQISLESDFNLGYQARHVGKPSEYQELQDEFQFSFNFKQWFKLNWNIYDFSIQSYIIEFTWFEFQPLNFHTFFVQPEDYLATIELLRDFHWENIDFHIGMGYFLDALSLKYYTVEYP